MVIESRSSNKDCSSHHMYYEHLAYYIRKIVKNKCDAEDVLQDSYLKYELKFKQYIDEEKEKNFLYCVAANESKNMLKFNKRHTSIDIDVVKENLLASNSNPYELIDDGAQIIKDEISSLPSTYSEVIKLLADGYSSKEIALKLNVNESTIRTRIERGKELLKKKLKEKEITVE